MSTEDNRSPASGDDPTTSNDGLADPVELALVRALEQRAGGPIDGTGSAAVGGPTGPEQPEPERFAAIEAAIGSGGRTKRRILLGAAAAVVLVVLAAVTVIRGGDGTEVTSIAGDPTDSVAPAPGTATTSVTSIVPIPDGVGDPVPPPTPAPTTTTTSVVVTPTVPAAPDIASVDLANFTYPSLACPAVFREGGGDLPESFTLVDGEARVPDAVQPQPGVEWATTMTLGPVVYGDVTGDGTDDALVRLVCADVPGDVFSETVAVVSMVGNEPKVLGWRSESGRTWTYPGRNGATGEQMMYPAMDLVTTVAAQDGHLVVRWTQVMSQFVWAASDHRLITVTYQWNGTEFVPVSDSDIVLVPGASAP